MFFDEILVKNKVLGKVWRAGNGQISEECDENTNLPKICENLDRWVDSEAMDARRRMSLRTSSVLIEGAAKLYKKGIQQLIKDVAKLDEDLVIRNRRNFNSYEEDVNTTSSGSYKAPEQMMRQAEIHPDISFEAQPREASLSPALDKRHSFSISHKNSRSTQSSKRQSNETIYSNGQPKKRLHSPDQAKELDNTSYPSSLTRSSDYKTDNMSSDLSESDESDHQTNGNRSETTATDSSDHASQVANNSDLSDQNHANHSNEQSPESTLKCLLDRQIEKVSRNSPTFTEIFDIVANLPDNDEFNVDRVTERRTDIIRTDLITDARAVILTDKQIDDCKISADCDTNSNIERNNEKITADGNSDKDCRVSIENSDRCSVVTNGPSEVSGHVSQGSIILNSSKIISRTRGNKKGSKSFKKRKDQASQTISFPPRTSDRDTNSFDENLPFGYLLIHDSIHSRIPSKIVFSSLNANVNNLFGL